MLDLGINILWFSKENYLLGNDLPNHKHKFFHYFYVRSGTANIKVNGRTYVAHSDELYLAHNGMDHSLEIIDTKGIQVIEIKFEINNDRLASDIKRLETDIKFTDLKVRHIFEWFIIEGIKKEPYFDDLINLVFLQMLLQLLRNKEKSEYCERDNYETDNYETEVMQSIDQKRDSIELDMERVACYIKSNLTLKLDLDDLARLAIMSKYHFCRNFKKFFRLSPMRYMNKTRIEKAKELMMYSELNVSQIAYNVGFDDTHYFSRFFRQCEGVSPREFMHKYKPNLYFFLQKTEYQSGNYILKVSDQ